MWWREGGIGENRRRRAMLAMAAILQAQDGAREIAEICDTLRKAAQSPGATELVARELDTRVRDLDSALQDALESLCSQP